MSDGSELQVCGAATENARRANSVHVLAADTVTDTVTDLFKFQAYG